VCGTEHTHSQRLRVVFFARRSDLPRDA
jgi:hypothetical protein